MELDFEPRAAVPQIVGGFEPDALEDLLMHEARGGHALSRHLTPLQEVADRLRRDPNVHASGTFLDIASANDAVKLAVKEHAAEISGWLADPSRRNDPFIAESLVGKPIAVSLTRVQMDNGDPATPVDSVRIVLFQDPAMSSRVLVMTAYGTATPPPEAEIPVPSEAEYRGIAAAASKLNLADTLRRNPNQHTAASFLTMESAERALQDALKQWSGDIDKWLSGEEISLRISAIASSPIGVTLKRDELLQGKTGGIPTPVFAIRLRRDKTRDCGYSVVELMPRRGF